LLGASLHELVTLVPKGGLPRRTEPAVDLE
jgi:hypothetical protein